MSGAWGQAASHNWLLSDPGCEDRLGKAGRHMVPRAQQCSAQTVLGLSRHFSQNL